MTFIPLALVLALCSKDHPRDVPARFVLDLTEASIDQVVAEVKRQTGITLELDECARARVALESTWSFKVRDISVTSALTLLFRPHYLEVRWKDSKTAVITPSPCFRILSR